MNKKKKRLPTRNSPSQKAKEVAEVSPLSAANMSIAVCAPRLRCSLGSSAFCTLPVKDLGGREQSLTGLSLIEVYFCPPTHFQSRNS